MDGLASGRLRGDGIGGRPGRCHPVSAKPSLHIPGQGGDANGSSFVGYGYKGSSNSQNRAIQEITFGTNTTLAKSPKWGALNLMFQYSYLQRNPWLVTGTSPTNAHLSMGFVNLRYTLPGAAPTLGK